MYPHTLLGRGAEMWLPLYRGKIAAKVSYQEFLSMDPKGIEGESVYFVQLLGQSVCH